MRCDKRSNRGKVIKWGVAGGDVAGAACPRTAGCSSSQERGGHGQGPAVCGAHDGGAGHDAAPLGRPLPGCLAQGPGQVH